MYVTPDEAKDRSYKVKVRMIKARDEPCWPQGQGLFCKDPFLVPHPLT